MKKSSSRKLSKSDQACASIKQAIINHELTSETPLTELALCQRFGFSRTPIREALKRLSSEGFIDYINDKGAFVAQINLDDLIQYYEIREALESMAASLCALRASETDIHELELLDASITHCLAQNDTEQAVNFDIQWHQHLIHACKNNRLETMSRTTLDLIRCVSFRADHAMLETTVKEHTGILNSIRSGDSVAASNRMRMHITSVRKYHLNYYYRL